MPSPHCCCRMPLHATQAAAMAEGGPLGYLVINVLEAAGHDSEDAVVWDPDFKQGYARGELRFSVEPLLTEALMCGALQEPQGGRCRVCMQPCESRSLPLVLCSTQRPLPSSVLPCCCACLRVRWLLPWADP